VPSYTSDIVRRSIKAWFGVLGAIVTLIVAWRFVYFGEGAVIDRFNRIPSAVVKQVWGSADLPPEWYYAKADIRNGPSIFVFGLTRQSFEGGRFCFLQVGSYAVRYTSERGLNNSLCFDASGDVSGLGHLFPRQIHGVREFIENAHLIESVLAGWPRCPSYMELRGTDGRYRVCTNPDVSSHIWPPGSALGQIPGTKRPRAKSGPRKLGIPFNAGWRNLETHLRGRRPSQQEWSITANVSPPTSTPASRAAVVCPSPSATV
jgi:hypothetical protein